jgi:cell wall integrity and stress response component
VTSVQVVTLGGSVITQTVTTSLPTMGQDKVTPKSKTGSTIGIAIGAAVGAVLAVLAAVFGCLWYRRRQDPMLDSSSSTLFPRRNISVLSKTGLLGTRTSTQALDTYESTSPTSERRNSRPLVFDQRLNPSAFMTHDDGSRTSVLTMQDERDYTRTLNVCHGLFARKCLANPMQIRNPDPVD